MEYKKRIPDFLVEVRRPDYNSGSYKSEEIGIFSSSNSNTGLISYSFSESLETIEDNFTLSFTPEIDENGLTWMDKIYLKDLVFISEFDQMRFIGIVENKRFSARMSGGTPNKQISITGVALGNLLSSFPLVIDQFLYQGNTLAEQANIQLKARLAAAMEDGYPLKNIMTAIYDSFFELSLKMGTVNVGGLGIKSIIDNFVGFGNQISSDVVLKYPIALSIYNVGINNIWDILSTLIVPPIYELFMLFDVDTEKYEAVFRQSPFEPSDWVGLPISKIPPVYLMDCDLGFSGNEIYTYYLCTVAGAGISDHKGMLLDSYKGYGQIATKDEDKWKIYGYRPLIIEFRYFDQDQINTYTTTANTMQSLGQMVKRWYEHNDDFANGSIKFMTFDEKEIRNPRIGERLSFMEGEFYIEQSEHSWSYGGPMETRLSISRGYRYSSSGAYSENFTDIGRRFRKITTLSGYSQHRNEGV